MILTESGWIDAHVKTGRYSVCFRVSTSTKLPVRILTRIEAFEIGAKSLCAAGLVPSFQSSAKQIGIAGIGRRLTQCVKH